MSMLLILISINVIVLSTAYILQHRYQRLAIAGILCLTCAILDGLSDTFLILQILAMFILNMISGAVKSEISAILIGLLAIANAMYAFKMFRQIFWKIRHPEVVEALNDLDHLLMENGRMPIQPYNQRQYIRRRKRLFREREQKRAVVPYNHISLNSPQIVECLKNIAQLDSTAQPQAISDLAWDNAVKNNQVNTDNPTVQDVRNIYIDVKQIYDSIYDLPKEEDLQIHC